MRALAAALSCLGALAACGGGGAGVPDPATGDGTITPAPPGTKAPAAAPSWTVPPGWRTESIAFPLDFAPSLPYRGVDELRFPPQFFEREDPQYFSYAFVWYIVAPGPADRETLERDLVSYFSGLAQSVGGRDNTDIQAADFKVALKGELATELTGEVTAYDAFKAKAPVNLHLRARRTRCQAPGIIALVFAASPRPISHKDEIWRQLDALAGDFKC